MLSRFYAEAVEPQDANFQSYLTEHEITITEVGKSCQGFPECQFIGQISALMELINTWFAGEESFISQVNDYRLSEYETLLVTVCDRLHKDAGLTNTWIESFLGCIVVPCGEYELWFGTANEQWEADVKKNGELIQQVVHTNCSSKSQDASQIALAITQAAMKFDEE